MKKNSSNTGININPFDAYYTPKQNFTVESLPINIDNMDMAIENTSINAEVIREEIYNVSGIKIHTTKDQLKGIYIIRKYMSDGSVINEKALF